MELALEHLRAALLENVARVPHWSWQIEDVFVRFNFNGQRNPLYWCFNNWMEPISLSRALHPEQQLVAMHSLHKIVKGKAVKAANLNSIASIYAKGILERAGDMPIVIGGNCQAAPIAEAVAHKILERTQIAPTLVFLDHMPKHNYRGPVMLLFGSRSERYNPFLRGIDPLPRWKTQFGSFSWHFLDAGHGKYFSEPTVDELAEKVTGMLSKESR